MPVLSDVLPSSRLECWRHFVLTCRILCKQELSKTELQIADTLLIRFCTKVETLYGKQAVTPNMYLHGHLKDVILDYGPISDYWLFSFERLNGTLGGQSTNNRAVEPQLMDKFLREVFSRSISYPTKFKEDFQPLVDSVKTPTVVGSVLDSITTQTFSLPTRSSRGVLSPDECEVLLELYSKIFPSQSTDDAITISSVYVKYNFLTIRGKRFGSSVASKLCKKRTPSMIIAVWDTALFGNPPTQLPDAHVPKSNERPVVSYYLKVFFTMGVATDTLYLAKVDWPQPHPDRCALGKPTELWCRELFESFGVHSFVPIKHLLHRCCYGDRLHHNELLRVIVPLVD